MKNSLITYVKNIFSFLVINNIPSVDLKRDFANLRFITYHSLVNMSYEELANLKIDYFIVDELQHLGAPVWGPRVEIIINTHPHIKVIGMTAYTTRDRGTAYVDMIYVMPG